MGVNNMDITGYRNNSDGKSHFGELSLKKDI